MLEELLHRRLDSLERQCSALRSLLLEPRACSQARLPHLLDGLQLALSELRALGARAESSPDAHPADEGLQARRSPELEIARVLAVARSLEDAALPCLRTLCESTGWDVGELWIVDGDGRRARCEYLWASELVDAPPPTPGSRTMVVGDEGGPAVTSGAPLWFEDIAQDQRAPRDPIAQHLGLRGMVHLPIPAVGPAKAILRLLCREARRCDGEVLARVSDVGEQLDRFLALRGPGAGPEAASVPSPSNATTAESDDRPWADERRRDESQMRSLMTRQLWAEERERGRLADDLHDGLSQTVALAQLKVSRLRQTALAEQTQTLDEIEQLLRQTGDTTRSISFELSPPVLHHLGLGPALEWLAMNIQERYGILVVLIDDGGPKPIDEGVRIVLFRAVRELLINAAKHARAQRVLLRVGLEEGRFFARIEDEGVGMQPAAKGEGIGLRTTHERLQHIGGTLHVASTPGKGTRVRLCAPMTSGAPASAESEK